jgi:transposase-like protein
MAQKRRRHSPAFKAKVSLAAIKGELTINEISSHFGVHPNQISMWKKQAIEELDSVFSGKRERNKKEQQELTEELYKQIGQLKVELDWVKKKSGLDF